MRAIKIDVERREVYEIDLDHGEGAKCEAIGCQALEQIPLDASSALRLDGQGPQLNPQPDKFLIPGRDGVFAGLALICQTDPDGRVVDIPLIAEVVGHFIRWAYDLQIDPQSGPMYWKDFGNPKKLS